MSYMFMRLCALYPRPACNLSARLELRFSAWQMHRTYCKSLGWVDRMVSCPVRLKRVHGRSAFEATTQLKNDNFQMIHQPEPV